MERIHRESQNRGRGLPDEITFSGFNDVMCKKHDVVKFFYDAVVRRGLALFRTGTYWLGTARQGHDSMELSNAMAESSVVWPGVVNALF